jgi:branched-chain amino acid transport system permease protein
VGYFRDNGFLMVSMVLNAVLALTVYLPYRAGQLSLATPGFYSIGGYLAATMSTKLVTIDGKASTFRLFGADLVTYATGTFPITVVILEMVLAAALCGVAAIVVGVPALRLRGIYLALATMAFVELVRVVALNVDALGGAVGIFKIPQPVRSQLGYLVMALPLLAVAAAFVARLERTRAGRAALALREDELAANAMGIYPAYHKVLWFALGGAFAGSAGVIAAHITNTWNSRQATFDTSVVLLAFLIIGGSRRWLGPVVGAVLLTALPEWLRSLGGRDGVPPALAKLLQDGRMIVFGVLLVLACSFSPQGLVRQGLIRQKRAS